jgi:hypothetical protein
MIKVIHDCFTERDNATWCWVRISSLPTLGTMLYKFVITGSPDYQNFAIGVAAIMAAVAFKNQSEKGNA